MENTVGAAMRHLCLFSGIGGFTLAAERAGMETIAFSEVDPFASAVLKCHWSDVSNLGDVREIDGRNLDVDVVTFGSPCQDLSVAGKRAGLAGARSSLIEHAFRIIAESRPTFALWENVPGAFSSNGGRDFGYVLDVLAELGAVDIAWRVLDAQHFGVPQRRRRIFLVADFRGERAEQVLFEREGVRGNPAPRRATGEGVAPCLRGGAAGGRSHGKVNGTDRMPMVPVWPEQAMPVMAHDAKGPPSFRDGGLPNAVCVGAVYGGMKVRRLTPTECERLQGFPDGWTAIEYRGKPAADTPRYRALGNAVAVPVVEWIMRRIKEMR